MEKALILSNPLLWFFVFAFTDFLFAIFMYVTLGKKISLIQASIYGLLCGFISLITRTYCQVEIIFFASIFSLVVFAIFTLRFNIIQSIIGVFIATIACAPAEIFIVFINNLMGISNAESPSVLLFNTFISWAFLILFSTIIYYQRIKIEYIDDINKKRNLGLIINSIVTVFLIAPNLLFFSYSKTSIPLFLIIFNIISIFIFFALALYNTLKGIQLNSKSQQLEIQMLYNKTLTDLINNLRSFRHDFSNTLNAISGYLALNDIKGLEEYFKELKSDYSSVNSLSIANSTIINNPPVYGLLVSKFYNANSKGINANLEITSDFSNSRLKTYDLCKILGIFWDNAIEAAENSDEKNINFILREFENNYIIIIENSFVGNVNIQEIFNNGFSTKGTGRGLGLWEVKNITEKSKFANLKTSIKDNKLRHEMTIAKY